MSYILEALKKSQQERELGHVPTLETSVFPAEEAGTRPNLWILVAVILAVLAVVIALYSALRGGPQAPETVQTAVETSRPEPAQVRGESATIEQASRPPAVERQELGEPDAEPEAAAPPAQEPVYAEADDSSVVIEAPAAAPLPQREEFPPPVSPKPPPAPGRPEDNKIPDDLIADIEAFKQEVRAGQSDKTNSKKEEKIAPEDLRLPKDVRKRLPEYIMSAHIYDKEPSKRFVLINGLKTREGEESREDITVVEIRPDGAVLSFEGNRFFQRR